MLYKLESDIGLYHIKSNKCLNRRLLFNIPSEFIQALNWGI